MTVDYTQMRATPLSIEGAARQAGLDKASYWWHPEAEEDRHALVFSAVKELQHNQDYRHAINLRNARLYGNVELLGFSPTDYARAATPSSGSRAPLNAIKSCVNTVTSKIAKNRPKPMFVTSGGRWKLKQRAKLLNKFCQGQFYEAQVYQLRQRMILDAQVFGLGAAKVHAEGGRMRAERVLPTELLLDDAEAIYGAPRTLYQVIVFHREVLLALYKDDKEAQDAIRAAPPALENAAGGRMADMVQVVEAWHLPSRDVEEDEAESAHDGRHVIAVSSGTLRDEEWRRSRFPFAFLRWQRPLIGFWPQGLVEDLTGIQLELNRLSKRIDAIIKLCSVPRTWMPRGAKVPPAHMSNDFGALLPYDGPTPPTTVANNAVPPEILQRESFMWAKAFEVSGVSQLSAGAQKPAGLNSQVALREFHDIESDRFVTFGQDDEEWCLDVARLFVDGTRELVQQQVEADEEAPGSYIVRMPDRKFVESIDWKDACLEEDEYTLQAFPISSLPTTPAARQQTVAEWIAQGWVTQEEGRQLLDFPDLEDSTNLAVAAIEDCDRTISLILDEGKYQPPEPYQNLAMLVQRATSAYLKARAEKYPASRLDKLRSLIDAAKDMLQPPAPPPGAAPPGPPGAGGPPLLPPGPVGPNVAAPGAPQPGALVAAP